MSGRKASEVSSLLNRANKAREVFNENIENSLNKFEKEVEEYSKVHSKAVSLKVEAISKEVVIYKNNTDKDKIEFLRRKYV